MTHAPILPGEHLDALRSRLHGELLLPDDLGWDEARRAWMLTADQHPAAVVIAADEHDVVETVVSAARLGLRVAPQGTGHGAGALSGLSDAILLRTGRLDGIEIDAEGQTARVGAGALWSKLGAVASLHGLAAVAGMGASVGVAGLVLGGGLGWLARSHGLAANSILAVEAVDAAGRMLRADAAQNTDLFWALRGGAAPVVVTAIELRLHPLEQVIAGGMLWPLDRAAEVGKAWQEWIGGVPESVTSVLRVLRYPLIPEMPEFLRGRSFVGVEAAIQEDAGGADELLAPLRALAPELDSIRAMAPTELPTVHGDPVDPVPAFGDSTLLSEISAESVGAFIEAALAPSSGPLLSIELRHLGGMAAPGAVDAGAVSGIDGEGLVYTVGIVPVPEAAEAVRGAASALVGALAPFASERVVRTFTERPVTAEALYGAASDRLREIAAALDPDRRILTAHAV